MVFLLLFSVTIFQESQQIIWFQKYPCESGPFDLFILRFNVQTNGEKIFSAEILENYPLVFLRGNHNIKLTHFPSRISGSGR